MWEKVFLFFSLNLAFILIGCNYYNDNESSNKNTINKKKVNLVPSKNQKQEKIFEPQKKNNLEQKSEKINNSDGLSNSDTVKEKQIETNLVDFSQTLDSELIDEIQTEITESLNNNKILDYLNSSEFTKVGPDNLIYYNDSTNNTVNVRNSKNSFFDIFIDSKEELKWPKGIEFIEYLNSEKKSSNFKDTSILVADNDNYVWEFYGPNYGNSEEEIEKRGKYRGIFSSGKMENPQDILLTPTGDLLVASADNHKILCYAGPNQENPGEFKKELFTLEESNGKPSKMYLDSKENKLYVKDTVHNKIETFNY